MNKNIQKCSNDKVTMCFKDICLTAGGVLGAVLVVGAVALTIAEAVKAIDKATR